MHRRIRLSDVLAYMSFALSGVAALMFEVVWTRKLGNVMGSTTYALSTTLAAFMTGLALGAAIGGYVAPKAKNIDRFFAYCQMGIGLTGNLTTFLVSSMLSLYMATYFTFHKSFAVFSSVQFILVLVIMIIPTTLMGMTFPLLIKRFSEDSTNISVSAGFLYSVNTLGAVIGAVSAGFLFIPWLGVTETSAVAGVVNLAAGAIILMGQKDIKNTIITTVVILTVLFNINHLGHHTKPMIVNAYMADRFENYFVVKQALDFINKNDVEESVLYHKEGLETDVLVMRGLMKDGLMIYSNGKLESGENTPGFELLGYLPMIARNDTEKPARVLNIGLGTGVTLNSLASFPGTKIESVELSDGVIEANRRFFRKNLFESPDIVHINDEGRRYLQLNSDAKYDVIVVSPSWAVEQASADLLTDEFFTLCANRMTRNGAISLWVDLFYANKSDIDMIIRTLRKTFPYAIMFNTQESQVLLVGATTPFVKSPEEIISMVHEHDPSMLDQVTVALTQTMYKSIPDGPINTDNKPTIEFHFARNIISGINPTSWSAIR